MSEEVIIHYVGRRQPPLYGTLSTDITGGDPLPPTATVRFLMRQVGTSTTKVDAPAVVVSEPLNQVRYDWAALDVDTEGFYVGWWRVTISGQDQDTPEFPVWIRAHAPVTNQYVSVEELKTSAQLTGETYADPDIKRSIEAACAAVDSITGRTFTLAAPATRLFTPVSDSWLYIGYVTSITSVLSDTTAWTENTHYYLDGGDTLRVLGGYRFPLAARGVSVTANFGVASVPPEVAEATQIIAAQLVKRKREAVFGVVASTLTGEAIRIARYDPHIDALLGEHTHIEL